MRKSSIALVLLVFVAFGVSSLFAQNGGKAEPKRIQFASGKSSAVLSGTLSNGQEMDYVFEARKGQMVTIRNATKSTAMTSKARNGRVTSCSGGKIRTTLVGEPFSP